MDMMVDLPATMELKVRDFIWTQNLDYEGLPFRCRTFFTLGHLVVDCHIVKKQIKGRVSWWKDFNPENLTVEAEEDNDVSNVLDSHIGKLGKEKDMVLEGVKNLNEAVNFPTFPINEPIVADKGVIPLSPPVSLCSPDLNIASLKISIPINPDENADPNWGEGWQMKVDVTTEIETINQNTITNNIWDWNLNLQVCYLSSGEAVKMGKNSPKSKNLRLLVNKKMGKIIYGEAGKDFVDLIFSFLILPIGSVMKLLKSGCVKRVGSVSNLYESMDKLPSVVMMHVDKSELISPKIISSNSTSTLSIDYRPEERNEHEHEDIYYVCGSRVCGHKARNRAYHRSCDIATHSLSKLCGEICVCGSSMNCAIQLVKNNSEEIVKGKNLATEEGNSGYGYVKETVTFIITDDLMVTPSSTIASISLLNRLNIKDISQLEERNANVGPNE
ncbi:hypothetical protein KI387_022502, partial [Taxus chinensis]